jgi:CheY-like chemotaxis protein
MMLSDIEMPNPHRGEVARGLRRLSGFGDVMIVAMSVNNCDDSRLAGDSQVFDDLLLHPWTLNGLKD